ncbi:MAG: glutamate--cysteine ligase [Magnetococcales bacterium]|nr:glutamate--cysteine ligase [Magnetococcales bacterium]MBF0322578.1 glutamate--cysteine ligase [Magnetococcales bacterium]
MSTIVSTDQQPVTSLGDLVAYMEAGCKPRSQWRIGTEHEKFGFRKRGMIPVPYDGPAGIRVILEKMAATFGWQPVYERGQPIALLQGQASITLEPGGQLELSGAPQENIHQTQAEINTHLDQLGVACRDLGVAFVGVGAQPKCPRAEIPWMPKERYRFMQAYLPTRGTLGLDMMTRTATVQANLDFASEADMVAKFRLALALQPLATALFANSPFTDGRPNGFLSWRSEIWRHTDPDRCGALPFVFAEGFGFQSYVEYALDVPMFFYYRDGQYHEAGGVPFREFLAGRLPALPGQYPTVADWSLHLTTLFPDVRLKHFLETRGADAGNSANLSALPALWKGILYDDRAMDEAWGKVAHWTPEERAAIQAEVPRLGLRTPIPGKRTLRELGIAVLEIARASLNRQAVKNSDGCDESIYLQPLFRVAESGITPAEKLLKAYRTRWGQSVNPLFREEEFESFYARCQK